MAQENSFDIVSKVEIQEVRNAIDQALKEIRQRFDLKDSHSEITLGEGDKEIQLASDGEYHLEAVKEILGQKLVKRGVSLKNLTYGKLEPALGKSVRQKISLQQGIPIEKAKEIVKLVMICIFDDQLAASFVSRLDFHTCSKMCAQLFLQTLRVATEFGYFLGFVFFFRFVSFFLHQSFRIPNGKLVQNNFVGE